MINMKRIKSLTVKALLIVILIVSYQLIINYEIKDNKPKNTINKPTEVYPFQMYFIDVGEADCILIKYNDEYTLVDAGNNKDGKKIVKYLKDLGIEHFEYVIGTHAHEDHIGGMDDIIKNFSIDHYYMPKTEVDMITYTEIKDELNKKGIKYETPKIDKSFKMSQVQFKVLWIDDNKEDINATSIVLKVTYQNTSYLLMADATTDVEHQILEKDLKSDLIKVAHHGSNHSSSAVFLKKVNPKYAIISVGTPNDYGFPKQVTLEKLEKLNTLVLRTDELGTIIASSDGNNIYLASIRTDTNYIE